MDAILLQTILILIGTVVFVGLVVHALLTADRSDGPISPTLPF